MKSTTSFCLVYKLGGRASNGKCFATYRSNITQISVYCFCRMQERASYSQALHGSHNLHTNIAALADTANYKLPSGFIGLNSILDGPQESKPSNWIRLV